MNTHTAQLGNFTVFGLTKDPEEFLNNRMRARLGIAPKVIDFGTAGHFFFYSSRGEVVESEDAIALKLGFVRTPTMSPLSACQLLENKLVTPHSIDYDALRGNALLGCFSKKGPHFAVYQTLIATPQLYYTRLDDGIVCATDIRCLLALLRRLDLNEDAVLMHFLFMFPVGPMTYFRNIERLWPGQMLVWHGERLDIRQAKDLRFSGDGPQFNRLDSASVEAYYECISDVMQAYLAEIGGTGYRSGSLLSGGIDSSVVQLLMNENSQESGNLPSFSYVAEAESFEFEVEYAKHASKLLQTRHTFHHISPHDFPDLLNRTIEALGQPNIYNESSPCHLALAEFLAASEPDVRYLFTGQGADGLHGISEVKKVTLFEILRRIPGARLGLQAAAALLAPLSESKSHGLQTVAKMLAERDNSITSTTPSVYVPTNYVAVPVDLERVRRCFGDREILEAFEYRLGLEEEYLNSTSWVEKVQVIELLTASYEPAAVVHQIYASQHKEPVLFFLDEDVVRMTFAFRPQIRLLKRMTVKPIMRGILDRESLSALAGKKKGGSIFLEDLYDWMKQGPLREMVQAIDRPSFISRSDFDEIIQHPDRFLWNLLTFDIFKKKVLRKLS